MSNSYGEYFKFGGDEKYIEELITKILGFYRSTLPLVAKDVTLSFKCRSNIETNKLDFYASVVILEPNDRISKDTGETAFELIVGKGEDIGQALINIDETITINIDETITYELEGK